MSIEPIQRARRYVDLWYLPDAEDELRGLLAETYVHHTPSGDFDTEQLLASLRAIRAALSNPSWKVVHALADGSLVAVYVTVEATQSGELLGLPATGRRVSTAGACFMRFQDGRLAEDWDAWALQTLAAPSA
jgi:predicted SnoaL-like aldol condensation-catalyzing enzyme